MVSWLFLSLFCFTLLSKLFRRRGEIGDVCDCFVKAEESAFGPFFILRMLFTCPGSACFPDIAIVWTLTSRHMSTEAE